MGGSKIMVVEDDADIRDGLSALLSDHGFSVLTAENGEIALGLLRDNTDVRAILLDVSMPVMNGATFRGQQLADPTIAEIPLILVTGRDDSAPLANALGATACVRKPLVGDELLQLVERYR